MISKGIYLAFNDIWGLIKLNMMFLVFSMVGVFLFGIGPSILMVSDLITTYRLDTQTITWQKAWQLWKSNFKRGNQLFLLYIIGSVFLVYNLFLAVQFIGLVWLIISLFLAFALLLLTVLFLYMVTFNSVFDISVTNLAKLAFVSLFMNFWVFVKLIATISLVLFLSWKMKGLILFLLFSTIIFMANLILKKQRDVISGKIYEDV